MERGRWSASCRYDRGPGSNGRANGTASLRARRRCPLARRGPASARAARSANRRRCRSVRRPRGCLGSTPRCLLARARLQPLSRGLRRRRTRLLVRSRIRSPRVRGRSTPAAALRPRRTRTPGTGAGRSRVRGRPSCRCARRLRTIRCEEVRPRSSQRRSSAASESLPPRGRRCDSPWPRIWFASPSHKSTPAAESVITVTRGPVPASAAVAQNSKDSTRDDADTRKRHGRGCDSTHQTIGNHP